MSGAEVPGSNILRVTLYDSAIQRLRKIFYNGFRAAVDTELAVKPPDVRADSTHAQFQFRGDLFVGTSSGQQMQDLPFAPRERERHGNVLGG
jgi:hypothetical protein